MTSEATLSPHGEGEAAERYWTRVRVMVGVAREVARCARHAVAARSGFHSAKMRRQLLADQTLHLITIVIAVMVYVHAPLREIGNATRPGGRQTRVAGRDRVGERGT